MLREEHGLNVFENRVLGRIFGPKRDEVTGGWRKLHNEEFYNCIHLQILLGCSHQFVWNWRDVHGQMRNFSWKD
jgi:hypothetical protein